MLYKFPPQPIPITDSTFLTGKTETFAKLKCETSAGKRNVHLTEHTLIFVIKGIKLLHFPGETLSVTPGNVVLLKKGIYVMAEYIEEGLSFEALMLFLPLKLLRSFTAEVSFKKNTISNDRPFILFSANALIQGFRDQLRPYFEQRLEETDALLAHKQKEILLLLIAAGYKDQLLGFLAAASGNDPEELAYIVKSHLLQPLTLVELANLTNRSLATFKRDFKRQFNTSPRQWITQNRLAHAQLLLQHTAKSVAEVADDCGFESASYFIRLFKNTFGYTPGTIRAESATI